jgi:hypothetical protein
MKAGEFREGYFNWGGERFMNWYIEYRGDIIWGATARILKNFLEVLSEPFP